MGKWFVPQKCPICGVYNLDFSYKAHFNNGNPNYYRSEYATLNCPCGFVFKVIDDCPSYLERMKLEMRLS